MNIATMSPYRYGQHVDTPQGRGFIVGESFPADGWGTRLGETREVFVRLLDDQAPTLTFRERAYSLAITPDKIRIVGNGGMPSAIAEASIREFMARKSTPGWKPAPLPKPRKPAKLSEARFAALMAEHGAAQVS